MAESPSLNAANKPSWGARQFRKLIARIDPELFSQPGGGITFNRFGIAKGVGGKFSEINGSGGNQFVIDRPSGGQADAARAMQNFTGITYASINAIARELMNIDFRLFTGTGDDTEEVTDHDVLDLLDSVNDVTTGLELKYLLAAHLYLAGNAYWYLDGVNSDLDKPKAIYPMDPSKVKAVIDRRTWPYQLMGYKFKDGTIENSYKTYEILHVRLPNPSSVFEGYSPVQAAAEYIDNDNYAMEFNRRFFLSGARPAGFLETDMVGETQVEALKAGFAAIHQGIANMNGIAVLPKGVKWVGAGTSPKDMDFKNLSEDAKERILLVLGVSRTILGTAESDTNRSTAETADYVFSKRVIKPLMELICSFLNERLTGRYGDDFYLSFTDPTPEDRPARTEEMKTNVGGQPVTTVNEAREEYLGLGPIEGGDELMKPTTMQSATEPAPDPNADPNAKPKPKPDEDEGKDKKLKTVTGHKKFANVTYRPLRTKLQKRVKQRQTIVLDLVAKVKKVLEDSGKVKKFESSPENDEAKFKEFDARTKKGEAQIAEAVRKINAEQKSVVLENLPKAIEKAVDPNKLFDLENWISITTDAMDPIYLSLYEAERVAAAAEIDTDIPPLTEIEKKVLHESVAKMATSYQSTVLAQIEKAVNEGLDSGASLADISKGVEEVYGGADEYGAERVAKTEAFRTTNAALKETWKQSGVVKTVRWYNATNPCPFCQSMNGKIISVDDNFFDSGESLTVGDGDDSQTMSLDYGDVGAPPLHPNCMCFIRPEEVSL
jgi:HK97 family phage portal protein